MSQTVDPRKYRQHVLRMRYEAMTKWDYIIREFESLLTVRRFIGQSLTHYCKTLRKAVQMKVLEMSLTEDEWQIVAGNIFYVSISFLVLMSESNLVV
jgi:hypothetical protein